MSQAEHPRILYVGGFEFPSTRARAVQSLHTAHALARSGATVRVVAQRARVDAATGESVLRDLGLEPHFRLSIVTVPALNIERLSFVEIHKRLAVTNWSYGVGAVADLLRSWPRPDVVWTRDPRIAWMCLAAKRIHGVPVVYEVHEVFSTRPRDNSSLEAGRIWGVAARTRGLERRVFDGADVLVPLTEACADYLVDAFGVPRSRLAVVPDAARLLNPRVEPAALQTDVVYAGQLYPWKGAGTLLEAVSRLSGVRLTVIGGSGDPAADGDLRAARALADSLGIADRTTFTGFVPHAEVAWRIAQARVAVVPLPDNLMARVFTSPLKLFEYMAAGVPIVASDLPSIREVLVHEQNALLVPPGDVPALSAAIDRLLTDRALAEQLRARARRDVAEYTWERRAERIIRAIAPIVGR